MTPSLYSFTLSIAAGFFLIIVPIAAALIWVSSNDRLIRD